MIKRQSFHIASRSAKAACLASRRTCGDKHNDLQKVPRLIELTIPLYGKFRRKVRQLETLKQKEQLPAPFALAFPAGFVRSAEHDGIAKAAHLICEQCRAGGAGVPAGKIFDFSRGVNKRQPQGEESRRYAMENPLFASGFFWRSRRDSNPRPSA